MDQEELIDYLRQHLQIRIIKTWSSGTKLNPKPVYPVVPQLKVQLLLKGSVISEDWVLG